MIDGERISITAHTLNDLRNRIIEKYNEEAKEKVQSRSRNFALIWHAILIPALHIQPGQMLR